MQVPHILGLRVENVIQFANSKTDIHSWIPRIKKNRYLQEVIYETLVNLLRFITLANSLIPQEFNEFVKNTVVKSEKHFANKRVMSVDAAPEFVNLFKNSVIVASRFELI